MTELNVLSSQSDDLVKVSRFHSDLLLILSGLFGLWSVEVRRKRWIGHCGGGNVELAELVL